MGGGVVFKVRSTQIRTKVLAPIFWRNLKVRPREVDPLLENIKAKSEATWGLKSLKNVFGAPSIVLRVYDSNWFWRRLFEIERCGCRFLHGRRILNAWWWLFMLLSHWSRSRRKIRCSGRRCWRIWGSGRFCTELFPYAKCEQDTDGQKAKHNQWWRKNPMFWLKRFV